MGHTVLPGQSKQQLVAHVAVTVEHSTGAASRKQVDLGEGIDIHVVAAETGARGEGWATAAVTVGSLNGRIDEEEEEHKRYLFHLRTLLVLQYKIYQ